EAQHPHCARSTDHRRYPRNSFATWDQNTAIIVLSLQLLEPLHVIALRRHTHYTIDNMLLPSRLSHGPYPQPVGPAPSASTCRSFANDLFRCLPLPCPEHGCSSRLPILLIGDRCHDVGL